VELLVDVSFFIDITLNFRTAQYNAKGNLVTDRRLIAQQYLKGRRLRPPTPARCAARGRHARPASAQRDATHASCKKAKLDSAPPPPLFPVPAGWFVLDALSVLPLDLVVEGWSLTTQMFKALRIARVAKIMRLLKSYRMLRLVRLPR
jgi:hypothetical protein